MVPPISGQKDKQCFWFCHDPRIFHPLLKYVHSCFLQHHCSGLQSLPQTWVSPANFSFTLQTLWKKSNYNSRTTHSLRFSPVAPIRQVVWFFCSCHRFLVFYLDWKLLVAHTLFEFQLRVDFPWSKQPFIYGKRRNAILLKINPNPLCFK